MHDTPGKRAVREALASGRYSKADVDALLNVYHETMEQPMKNKLGDLNNHLFAQLERMADENMTPEQIEQETKRTGAIVSVADHIIRNADLQLKAAKLYAEHREVVLPHLPLIGRSA